VFFCLLRREILTIDVAGWKNDREKDPLQGNVLIGNKYLLKNLKLQLFFLLFFFLFQVEKVSLSFHEKGSFEENFPQKPG
jgi:hypothetical protein